MDYFDAKAATVLYKIIDLSLSFDERETVRFCLRDDAGYPHVDVKLTEEGLRFQSSNIAAPLS